LDSGIEIEEEIESESQQLRETIPKKRKAKNSFHNSTGKNSGKQGNVQVTVAPGVRKSLTSKNEFRKKKSFPESSREKSQPKETVQVPLDAGVDYLVDTDSEIEHEDNIEEGVELESEQIRKILPRKPRRRNTESQTTPLGRVQTLRRQRRGVPLDALDAPLPPNNNFIGRISNPTNEKTRKETPKGKGKKTLPPHDTCNNEETVRGSPPVVDLSIEGRRHDTVVTCVGYPSVMEIAPLARICAEDFRTSTSEQAKEEVMWTVFRMLHDKKRFPLVLDTMTSIRQTLEQESPMVLILELGNMDICRGTKPPRSYLQRTSEFATQYDKLMGTDKKRNLLKNIVMTLRKEGFRFVEEKKTHGGWQEMSIESAIDVMRRRMQRLTHDKSESSKKLLGKLERPPGPFVQMDGAPAGRAIVCGKRNEAKGNPYNAAYRTKISEVASEFKNAVGSTRKPL
jgi:hypothetical protein